MHKSSTWKRVLSGLVVAAMLLTSAACGGGGLETIGQSEAPPAVGAPEEKSTPTNFASEGPTEQEALIDDLTVPEGDGAPLQPRIGSDPRKAIVYECWYALRKSYLSTPNDEGPHDGRTISGSTVSDWNYLASDQGAFDTMRGYYRSNSSVSPWFGTSDTYALKGGYGRGGQCTFFASLIIYRAVRKTVLFYGAAAGNVVPVRYARPGDVILRKNYGGLTGQVPHVAVVVKVLGDGLDVVDSNWVGYRYYPVASGYLSSEIIGRHPLTWSQLDRESWRCLSGSGRWY